MSMRTLALASVAAAGIGFAAAPASADGTFFSFGVHGGNFGHGHHFRHGFFPRHGFHRGHRHFRHFGSFGHRFHRHRRHRDHVGLSLRWWPAFPTRQVYVYRQYYYAPGYPAPGYAAPAYQAPAYAAPEAVDTRYCREYTREIIVNGQPARAYGQACRQPDGSWRIVSEE